MADLYVSWDTGNDSTGDGTSGTPWKTLQKGIDEMSAGDTLNVMDGTYLPSSDSESARNGRILNKNGTANSWYTIKNAPGHSPIVVSHSSGAGTQGNQKVIDIIDSSYIHIEGLEVSWGKRGAIEVISSWNDGNPTTHHIILSRIHAHDCGSKDGESAPYHHGALKFRGPVRFSEMIDCEAHDNHTGLEFEESGDSRTAGQATTPPIAGNENPRTGGTFSANLPESQWEDWADGTGDHAGIAGWENMSPRFCAVRRCLSYDNDAGKTEHCDGINFRYAIDNIIEDCIFWGNGDDGLDVLGNVRCVIRRCIAFSNGQAPNGDGNGFKFGVRGGYRNLVYGNFSFTNTRTGFDTAGTEFVKVYNNTSYDCGSSGGIIFDNIRSSATPTGEGIGNIVTDSVNFGIWLAASARPTINHNCRFNNAKSPGEMNEPPLGTGGLAVDPLLLSPATAINTTLPTGTIPERHAYIRDQVLSRFAIDNTSPCWRTGTFIPNVVLGIGSAQRTYQITRQSPDPTPSIGAFDSLGEDIVEPPPADNWDADLEFQSHPPVIEEEGTGAVVIDLRNTGNTAWVVGEVVLSTHAAARQSIFGATWSDAETAATVPSTIQPGAVGRFTFTLTAPAASADAYTEQFQLERVGVERFGPIVNVGFTVSATAPPAGDEYDASLVGLVGHLENLQIVVGETALVEMRFKNLGTEAWAVSDVFLVSPTASGLRDEETWATAPIAYDPIQSVPGLTNEGDEVTFSFLLRAPSNPGTYPIEFRLHSISGDLLFGPELSYSVKALEGDDPLPPLPGARTDNQGFVAANGSDNSNGAEATPWATLNKAMATLENPKRVILLDGTYTTAQVISAANGGTKEFPAEIVAQNRNGAVFDGATYGVDAHVINVVAPYITLRGLEVKNGPLDGIKIEADHVHVDQCWLHHNKNQNISAHTPSDGLTTRTGTSITRCIIEHATDEHGIYASGDFGVIAHNIIRFNSGLGLHGFQNFSNLGMSGWLIMGNLVYANSNIGLEIDHSHITDFGGPNAAGRNWEGNWIIGNTIVACRDGIMLRNPDRRLSLSPTIVRNNLLIGFGSGSNIVANYPITTPRTIRTASQYQMNGSQAEITGATNTVDVSADGVDISTVLPGAHIDLEDQTGGDISATRYTITQVNGSTVRVAGTTANGSGKTWTIYFPVALTTDQCNVIIENNVTDKDIAIDTPVGSNDMEEELLPGDNDPGANTVTSSQVFNGESVGSGTITGHVSYEGSPDRNLTINTSGVSWAATDVGKLLETGGRWFGIKAVNSTSQIVLHANVDQPNIAVGTPAFTLHDPLFTLHSAAAALLAGTNFEDPLLGTMRDFFRGRWYLQRGGIRNTGAFQRYP